MTTLRPWPHAVVVAAFVSVTLISSVHAGPRLVARESRGAAPHVVFSTLLGGAAGSFDGASDVAVDAEGNAYVVGATESSDFPVKNAFQSVLKGSADAFVAKFAPDGQLVFSTFLGGGESESGTAVAVDSAGAIVVVGSTNSPDFPKKGAFQTTLGGGADAFVTKLSADGRSIVFSSYLGGNGAESPKDVALDSDGMIYVAGTVLATGATVTFPAVNPVQASYGGGDTDAFASFVAPDGSTLVFSTLFDAGVQGSETAGTDLVSSIRVAPTGDVFVAGNLDYDEDKPEAPFVSRLRPTGGRARIAHPFDMVLALRIKLDLTLDPPQRFAIMTSIVYLTGVNRYDIRKTTADPEILILADGLCHPAPPGETCDEPAAFAAYDPDLQFKRAENLPQLREFFADAATSDAQGALYVAGDISSDRLTTLDPVQATFGGQDDVVVAAFTPGSAERAFTTFFGGDGYDSPTSIAVDAQGNVYVVGLTTLSATFPTTSGAVQSVPKGRNDGFVVKIAGVGPFPAEPDFSLSFASPDVTVARGTKVTVPLDVERIEGFDGKVTVTSPPATAGIKLPKKPRSTTGTTVSLKIKVKPSAPTGSQSFTFTGRDAEGRERSATLTLTVE
jgi:hypothetical protein